ncbi:MAG: hypothetical protein AAGG68_14825 [Bacteroidota bacterium]
MTTIAIQTETKKQDFNLPLSPQEITYRDGMAFRKCVYEASLLLELTQLKSEADKASYFEIIAKAVNELMKVYNDDFDLGMILQTERLFDDDCLDLEKIMSDDDLYYNFENSIIGENGLYTHFSNVLSLADNTILDLGEDAARFEHQGRKYKMPYYLFYTLRADDLPPESATGAVIEVLDVEVEMEDLDKDDTLSSIEKNIKLLSLFCQKNDAEFPILMEGIGNNVDKVDENLKIYFDGVYNELFTIDYETATALLELIRQNTANVVAMMN